MLNTDVLSTSNLMALLNISKMALHRLAARENWQSQPRKARGGGKEWLISSMPRKTQLAVIQAIIRSANDGASNNIEPTQEGAGQVAIPMPEGIASNTLTGGNQAGTPVLYRTIQNSGSGRAVADDVPGRGGSNPVCQGFGHSLDGQSSPPALPQRQPLPQHQLTDKQRAVMDARMAFVNEVESLSAITGGKSTAIHTLVLNAKLRQLSPRLQRLLETANDRPKHGRSLSVRTLYNWCAAAQHGPAALAPNYKLADMRVPGWLTEFLKFYQQPQKPSIPEAYAEFCKNWPLTPPSIHAVRRMLTKMGVVDKNRGRMGHRALKDIQPFVRRDTSKLLPNEIFSADGHTFDAEIAHPDNGRPFRPEVTAVIDVATRQIVGFSITLSESTLAVIDALSMAVKNSGVCSIFYVDRGPGYVNDILKAPGIGLVDRLGMTITHSIAYNSQARGIIERSHRTILVSLARKMATNVNKAMDTQAKQFVFKITRDEIKKTGSSRWLMPWDAFRELLARHIEEYNDRPHSSLPKIWDESIGKQRRLSPNEMRQHYVANGWEPMMLSDDEADDLFRPYETRVVRRGEVRLLNNIYFDKALTDFHGEVVRVGYNVADASKVWVRNNEGRLICVAKVNANRRDYYPKSFIEQANEKRLKASEKRHKQRLADIQRAPVIDAQYSEAERLERVREVEQYMAALPEPEVKTTPAGRPELFWNHEEHYRWLAIHLDEWNENDRLWLEDYIAGPLYEEFREIYQRESIAWEQINPKLKEVSPCAASL